MGICDICSSPGMGTVVGAGDMRKAVKKGFNPFALGLVTDPMGMLAGSQAEASYAGWKVIVAQDTSDWNICSRCMAELKPYLSGRPKATGVTEATVAKDQILDAMAAVTAGRPPTKPKKRWQVWK